MTPQEIITRFKTLTQRNLPNPGAGATQERHRSIFAAGREDLSLAKLIEAHWDAVAILHEAGKQPAPGAAYAVWASEIPGKPLTLTASNTLLGNKEFCSGAPLVDRALITVADTLVEVDLHAAQPTLTFDESGWLTQAFAPTRTATVTFNGTPIAAIIGQNDWYTSRPGFWQGACGPAAAWAGGAAGLLDHALLTKRADPHTLAHLGAMHANIRAMEAVIASASAAFDRAPQENAMAEALAVRHIVEQLGTDTLHRFTRALGPAPLVKHNDIFRRYAELDLFLRQSHAERDLEALGAALRRSNYSA